MGMRAGVLDVALYPLGATAEAGEMDATIGFCKRSAEG